MSTSTLITDWMGSGTAADKPSSPPIASSGVAFYYATDTTTLYMWDTNASTWKQISLGGGGGGSGLWSQLISATPTLSNTGLSVGGSGNGANNTVGVGLSSGYLHKTPASSPVSYSVLLASQSLISNGGFVGIGFGDGTHLVIAGMILNSGPSGWEPFVQYQTPYGTYSSNDYLGSAGVINPPCWFKVYNDGTNLNFYVSCDGVSWVSLHSETITTHLSSVSDLVFIGSGSLMSWTQGTS